MPGVFTFIAIGVLILLLLILIISNIQIVQQSKAYVIERLGAFSTVWEVGLHFKLPFIERVAKKEKGKALYDSYMEQGVVPMAYEVCWGVDDGSFEKVAAEIVASGSKIWVNTIWASLCGGIGNDDDAAFQAADPSEVYDRYLKAGVSIMQTDRPEMLIKYLKMIC